MEGKRMNKTTNGMKSKAIFISIIVIIVIIAIIVIFNFNNSEKDVVTTTPKSYTSSSSPTKTDDYTTTTTTHYCDASGCNKKGTYSIDGVSGKEYYCYEHYKQMEAWADMIMGY